MFFIVQALTTKFVEVATVLTLDLLLSSLLTAMKMNNYTMSILGIKSTSTPIITINVLTPSLLPFLTDLKVVVVVV